MNKVETVPTLDMATQAKAFSLLTEGFALLGFTNLEVPGHRTHQNYQGVYLVALPNDNDYALNDYAKLADHVWLRVSVGTDPDGNKRAHCDFKAGPSHWLSIEGTPENWQPPAKEDADQEDED